MNNKITKRRKETTRQSKRGLTYIASGSRKKTTLRSVYVDLWVVTAVSSPASLVTAKQSTTVLLKMVSADLKHTGSGNNLSRPVSSRRTNTFIWAYQLRRDIPPFRIVSSPGSCKRFIEFFKDMRESNPSEDNLEGGLSRIPDTI